MYAKTITVVPLRRGARGNIFCSDEPDPITYLKLHRQVHIRALPVVAVCDEQDDCGDAENRLRPARQRHKRGDGAFFRDDPSKVYCRAVECVRLNRLCMRLLEEAPKPGVGIGPRSSVVYHARWLTGYFVNEL